MFTNEQYDDVSKHAQVSFSGRRDKPEGFEKQKKEEQKLVSPIEVGINTFFSDNLENNSETKNTS